MSAIVSRGVEPGEYDRYDEQATKPVTLVGGRKYYFEVVHVAGASDAHCSVAWSAPGIERTLLGGECVSQYGEAASDELAADLSVTRFLP